MQANNGASFELNWVIFFYCEGVSGRRYPFMLDIIIVLGNNFYFGSNQKWWVKTHTELSNKIYRAFLEGIKVAQCAWLRNCAQIIDEIILGHSDSVVNDIDIFFFLVGLNFDLELGFFA